MPESIHAALDWLLGIDQDSLSASRMAARALLVYPLGIVLVRLGKKRFIGEFTAFDVILGFTLGSLLASAITDAEGFVPKLAAAFALVLLHYVFSKISFHSDRFGDLIKGHATTLVEDGEIRWDAMRRSHISRQDLLMVLRKKGELEDPAEVRLARLERSGDVSVIPKRD
jgi:uncharacterized membrane protein YcaP (DUF421 family)